MDLTRVDWQGWYDRHGPALLLYARQITGSLAEAEDAMHDGFVRFWKRREQVDDPLAYLYRSTRSASLDLRRGNSRRRRRELVRADQSRPDSPEPWHEAARDEAAQRLRDAVASLDEPDREVLVMKVWGGLTFDQIATAVQAPRSTVAARYKRVLSALRQRLPAEEVVP